MCVFNGATLSMSCACLIIVKLQLTRSAAAIGTREKYNRKCKRLQAVFKTSHARAVKKPRVAKKPPELFIWNSIRSRRIKSGNVEFEVVWDDGSMTWEPTTDDFQHWWDDWKRLHHRRTLDNGNVMFLVEWNKGLTTWEPTTDDFQYWWDNRPVRMLKLLNGAWLGHVGIQPYTEWIVLQQKWLMENFTTKFIDECRKASPTGMLVPDGRAASALLADTPQHALLGPSFGSGVRCTDVPVVKYPQGELDACGPFSTASAVAFAGLVDAAGLPFDDRIINLFDPASPLRRFNDMVTFIHENISGWRVRRLKNPQVADVVKPSPFVTIMALQDSDGSSEHTLATVGRWIFDTNHQQAIPLSTDGFDQCCLGNTTLVRVVKAVQLYPSGHKMIKLWKESMPAELRELLID